MGFSEPVDLPEHGESGLVFVLIFEDLRYYCRVHSAADCRASTGYLRIGLDLRIPTVPKNLDFRFRIGRKLRKTEKTISRPFRSITAALGHVQT